jgi:hypothetical protein
MEFNPQDVSNTLNAFAKTGVKDEKMFTLFGNRITNDSKLALEFKPQESANILNAFAKRA